MAAGQAMKIKSGDTVGNGSAVSRPARASRLTCSRKLNRLTISDSKHSLDLIPLRRCCPSHADWPTLAEHLAVEFPEATLNDVVRAVTAARHAVELAGLADAEARDAGETIARQDLLLVKRRALDVARLDPESRARGA